MIALKIIVNYDLLDKIREAKTGFSIKKFRDPVLFYSSANMAIQIPINIAQGASLDEYIIDLLGFLSVHSFCLGSAFLILTKVFKAKANEDLTLLSSRLKDIYVDTSADLLMDAYKYKTEMDFDTNDTGLPILLEKKYIMVPVNNEWDNNSRSLVQEHVVGTKEYALSYGEPEKKVLTLGRKQYSRK